MLLRCLAVLALVTASAGVAHAQANRGAAQQGEGQQEAKPDNRLPKSRQQEASFPQDITWTAIDVNGRNLESVSRPSFVLDGNFRISGFGGCNTFSATAYPLRGQALAVGPIALTKKACDKGLMDFERAFLTSLRSTQNWSLEAGRLVLKSQRGTIRFERSL